jgi:hypothetical protein
MGFGSSGGPGFHGGLGTVDRFADPLLWVKHRQRCRGFEGISVESWLACDWPVESNLFHKEFEEK